MGPGAAHTGAEWGLALAGWGTLGTASGTLCLSRATISRAREQAGREGPTQTWMSCREKGAEFSVT